RVVYKADKCPTIGMCLITSDVDDELFAQSLVYQALPGALHLYNDKLVLEKKVHPRRTTRVRRGPFLIPDVLEIKTKQRVDQILDIILILDLQGLAVRMTGTQLAGNEMKATTEGLDSLKRRNGRCADAPTIATGWLVPVLRDFIDERLKDRSGVL